VDVTAKFGWAWDRTLIYGKAGWGSENINSTATPTFAGFNDDRRTGGLVLGGGIEYAMAPNWSIGVEYLHVDVRSPDFAPSPFVAGVTRDIRGDDNIVRAFVNFKLAPPL
jgi:outer membrane immunogenic protein